MTIWNFIWIGKYKMDLEVKCTVKAVTLPWVQKDTAGLPHRSPDSSGRTVHSPDKPPSSRPLWPSLGMQTPSLSFGSSQGLQMAKKFPLGRVRTPLTPLIPGTSHCVQQCTGGLQGPPNTNMQAAQISHERMKPSSAKCPNGPGIGFRNSRRLPPQGVYEMVWGQNTAWQRWSGSVKE